MIVPLKITAEDIRELTWDEVLDAALERVLRPRVIVFAGLREVTLIDVESREEACLVTPQEARNVMWCLFMGDPWREAEPVAFEMDIPEAFLRESKA